MKIVALIRCSPLGLERYIVTRPCFTPLALPALVNREDIGLIWLFGLNSFGCLADDTDQSQNLRKYQNVFAKNLRKYQKVSIPFIKVQHSSSAVPYCFSVATVQKQTQLNLSTWNSRQTDN